MPLARTGRRALTIDVESSTKNGGLAETRDPAAKHHFTRRSASWNPFQSFFFRAIIALLWRNAGDVHVDPDTPVAFRSNSVLKSNEGRAKAATSRYRRPHRPRHMARGKHAAGRHPSLGNAKKAGFFRRASNASLGL